MELTILGKYGPFPPAGGATSGYLLRSGDANVLIECGSGILSRLQQHIGLSDISAIILSHLHSDHMADMSVLRYAMQFISRQPIPVFAPTRPTAEYDMLRSGAFEFLPIEDGMKARIGGMEFEFTEMTHPVISYGMRISDGNAVFAYTGDTNLNDRLTAFAKDADVLLADTGLLSRDKTRPSVPHLTALEAGEIAAKAGVKRLICSHINPNISESEVLEEASINYSGAQIAQEGQTIRI